MAEEKVTEQTEVEQTAPTPATDEAKKIAELEAQIAALKNTSSKNASEAAKYRHALAEKQTEAEKAEMERKEHDAAIMAELEALRKEKTVSTYRTSLMSNGYDAETADKAANLLADGKMTEYFAVQKKHLEATEARIRAEALNNQPTPSAGQPINLSASEDAEQAMVDHWMGLR